MSLPFLPCHGSKHLVNTSHLFKLSRNWLSNVESWTFYDTHPTFCCKFSIKTKNLQIICGIYTKF